LVVSIPVYVQKKFLAWACRVFSVLISRDHVIENILPRGFCKLTGTQSDRDFVLGDGGATLLISRVITAATDCATIKAIVSGFQLACYYWLWY